MEFTEENGEPTAVVPLKRVKVCDGGDCEALKENMMCQVEWSNKRTYPARAVAIGTCMHL